MKGVAHAQWQDVEIVQCLAVMDSGDVYVCTLLASVRGSVCMTRTYVNFVDRHELARQIIDIEFRRYGQLLRSCFCIELFILYNKKSKLFVLI